MSCYRKGGCGPYEMYSCLKCPASKPEYANKYTNQKAAADVNQIIHAYWIKDKKERLYYAYDMSGIYDFPLMCSNCKTDVTEYDYEETPFCPFCGAKMDGSEFN